MNRDQLVSKLGQLVKTGRYALEHEINNPVPGFVAPTTINGTNFRKFISDAKTLLERHLDKHELYKSLHDDLYSNHFNLPSTVERIISNLESIASDEEFLIDFERKQNTSTHSTDSKTVFIVHGHDIDVLDEVEQIIWRIGLTPMIMKNEANRGLTLIEKLERYTNVGFAIVLYTACDVGRDKKKRDNKPCARQNVVFEHGYLLNRLGRDRVVALVEDGVETPGDVDGLVYISLNDAEWKQELLRELKAAGYEIDATKA